MHEGLHDLDTLIKSNLILETLKTQQKLLESLIPDKSSELLIRSTELVAILDQTLNRMTDPAQAMSVKDRCEKLKLDFRNSNKSSCNKSNYSIAPETDKCISTGSP